MHSVLNNLRSNRKLTVVLILSTLSAVICNCFIYDVFPDKYFYDRFYILSTITDKDFADSSYIFAAEFYNAINIFNLTTVKQFGIYISLLAIPFLVYGLTRQTDYTNMQYLFILATFALFDLYVFGSTKEFIQSIFVYLFFAILSMQNISDTVRLLLMIIVIAIEALCFRTYYILVAVFFVSLYVFYLLFLKLKSKNSFKVILYAIFFTLVCFFIVLAAMSLVFPDYYEKILFSRSSVNSMRIGSSDANTIILEPFGKNSNIFIFIFNYLVNAIRLMFPWELFLKGPLQFIFSLYQTYVSYIFISSLRKLNKSNCLWFITLLSFFFTSVIFEPDFGSWVRHESVYFLIFIRVSMFFYDENYTFSLSVKRVTDIIMATLGIILSLPLMVICVIGVKASGKGSVIFKQKRVGKNGREFYIYKFRSMIMNNESDTAWSTENDERITPFGAFIRKFSIDEIPQFFNVLKGEMSMIGPRPELPYFVEKYSKSIQGYADRHRIEPGITGWAQVHGCRGDTSIEKRAFYDNEYIDNRSLFMDIRIVFMTLFSGIISRGKNKKIL